MERIWLKSYPPGVPADVDVGTYRSLGDLFETSVGRFGERAAFVNMGKAISYRELDRMSRDFGAYLRSVLQLPPGARVAIMMPNVLQYPVAIAAILA